MILLALYAALLSVLPPPIATGILARRGMVVHDQRHLPATFVHAGTPDPDSDISLKIALAAKDVDGLEKALYDVSTPGSVLYGQHLSLDEVCTFAGL